MGKVYVEWAFKENEQEKAKVNRETYKEINEKWRINRHEDFNQSEINEEDFDLIIERTAGYNHATYRIIKNETDLTQDEIALVCDGGNLCFGYTMKGSIFYVFED